MILIKRVKILKDDKLFCNSDFYLFLLLINLKLKFELLIYENI